MLQQRQLISGQTLDLPPAFAPQTAVETVHTNAGAVPAADVVNKSRMSATYNRAAKGRFQQATARDPTAFSLHKRAAPGAEFVIAVVGKSHVFQGRNASHNFWNQCKKSASFIANSEEATLSHLALSSNHSRVNCKSE